VEQLLDQMASPAIVTRAKRELKRLKVLSDPTYA
jgi:hypothetical protein